jgi:DNA-binding transcriptional MerR regulator
MSNTGSEEPRYTRIVAAQLADTRIIRGGSPGYSASDIRRMARIGRLHQDLGLDFASLEIVLNMREQILELREQLDQLERDMLQREEKLLRELVILRRQIAVESKWS